jgi:hypothetical protein
VIDAKMHGRDVFIGTSSGDDAAAEPGDHADPSVSPSRLADQNNTGTGQHIATPVSELRVAGP